MKKVKYLVIGLAVIGIGLLLFLTQSKRPTPPSTSSFDPSTIDTTKNPEFDPYVIKIEETITKNDLASFKLLLTEASTSFFTVKLNHFRYRPIHRVAQQGLIGFMDALLTAGDDLNRRTFPERGYTPLYIAVDRNHPDMVKYLLEKGADQTIRQDAEWTALSRAMINRNDNMIQILLGQKKEGKILQAVLKGQTEEVKKLIESNPGLANYSDSNSGLSALHLASSEGNLKILKILIAYKSSINIKDEQGKTPLHWASEKGRFECVTYLLENSASPNLKDNWDYSPLHYAVAQYSHDRLRIVKALLKHGADPNLQGEMEHQYTALHSAALNEKSDPELVELLIESGAKVNALAQYNQTSLHLAVVNPWNIKIAEMLLDKGVDINAKTIQGETALSMVEGFMESEKKQASIPSSNRIYYDRLIKLLKKHGAK